MMKVKKLLSLLLILGLLVSAVACAQGEREGKTIPAPEVSTANPEANATADETAKPEEEPADPEAVAAPALTGEQKLGQCFKTPERTKYALEEGVPKNVDEITKEDRDNGYVVDFLMGVSYYKPEAWRELAANSVMVDTFGNDRFEGEPIYAGKAFYYVTPALAMEFEALAAADDEFTDTKEWEDNLKAQRAPLFTLILYRTDQMQEDLTSLMENNDFPVREVIKAHGDLTLVMGMGRFDENYCGEVFMPDYESLYEGIRTIYDSLSAFPPESYTDTLVNRIDLNFTTLDLNEQKATEKDVTRAKQNLILIWDSNLTVPVQAFDALADQQAAGELKDIEVTTLLVNKATPTITEEERAQLLKRFGDKELRILLSAPSMEEGLLKYLSRYPTYLLVDKKGNVLGAHSGYLKPEDLQNFIKP